MVAQLTSEFGTEPLIERLRRATIGRYDVYAELGSGGMATVFLALDLALDRKVAIKVMSPALLSSPDALARFKREAKVAAALSHPNIIGIYAVGEDPELAYYVMKFVEGRSLDSVIKDEGPQSVPFVQTLFQYAGNALAYAHERGVVHRDVKPANFMLDKDGWLIVTDFGIAKMEDAKGLTMSGTLIGTPYYMSPEQFNGKNITGSSDQYALGIVTYELLTGKTPFHADTLAEVMRGHLLDPPPPVREARPDVPLEMEKCISKMLEKKPEDRFPSLSDAVAAMGSILPSEEKAVRTQIINLAKTGALQQPRMSVPLSPMPARDPARPPAKPAAATVPSAAAPARPSAPTIQVAPAPQPVKPQPKSKTGLMAAVAALVVIGGGAAAVYSGKLGGLTGIGGATGPTAQPVVDSAALAAQQRTDSIARLADSLQRLFAQARTDSLERALAAAQASLQASRDAEQRRQNAARGRDRAGGPTQIASGTPAESSTAATKSAAPATTTAAPVAPAPAPTPPRPAEPTVPDGQMLIQIGTETQGAQLYIGSRRRAALTPGRIEQVFLPAGEVLVSVRKDGCQRWEQSVNLASGKYLSLGLKNPTCPAAP